MSSKEKHKSLRNTRPKRKQTCYSFGSEPSKSMDLSVRPDLRTGNSTKRMRHGWGREVTGNSERFAKISNRMEVKAIGSSFVFGVAISCGGIY